MIDKIKKNDCTGCKMCQDICPVDAIYFECDEEGFWYPKVDYEKCIKCEKCVKTCPSFSEIITNYKEPKVLEGYILDDKVRLKSTSGGMYYALASYILENGGHIVGSSYRKDYKSAYHMISNDFNGLEKIMGSKYFQSDTEGIYTAVKSVLEEGKPVLFCGTPCQNAGLIQFLNKKYKSLYLVDFICRGINSPKVFRNFVEELENIYQDNVKKVQLKNKDNGWKSLGTKVEFQNGKIYLADKTSDLWIQGYIYGNFFIRPCCSQCRYKEIPRISDISLGDFWGINCLSKEDERKGVSVILVNSEQGEKLINNIADKIFMKEKSLDEAISGNPCLVESVKVSDRRKKFFRELEKTSFSKAVAVCLKTNFFLRGKRKLQSICRKTMEDKSER